MHARQGGAQEGHADVLIVGAGPSGGVVARRLVEAGCSVVCLEQGDWPDPAAYRGGELDGELTSRKQWALDPNTRGRPADYRIDLSDSDHIVLNFNGVGGGTTLFNAVWPRLPPESFRTRTLWGYGDDWPVTYEELLPYYERTDRQVGVSGLAGNPAYPQGGDFPLPPLPIRDGGMVLARAQHRLGRHWWPETNAILSAPYDGRRPCVQRGTCSSGCGEGAKSTADLTHWRHVVAAGSRLVTGARVRRIVLDAAGRAAGAEWYDVTGRGHLQTADVVVCAANGIGTPRLLLASAAPGHPDGLANGSGLLGRNLMMHVHAMADGVFEEHFESWQGHNGSWIGSMEYYASDEARGYIGSCRWSTHTTGGPLGHVFPFGGGPGWWGNDHHAHMAERLGRTLRWSAEGEDIADVSNRVELSSEEDAAGLPIPKVTYKVFENSHRLLAWQMERMIESMLDAGATSIDPVAVPVSAHLLGTARMGTDPDRSVVGRYGLTHEIPNLLIADGSVFVTSGAVNPTSTICALAARAADHLVERRGDLARPELPRSFALGAPAPRKAPQTAPPEEPTGAPSWLGAQERTRLEQLADTLIPAGDGRPSAGAAGIGGRLVDAVLRSRPDLAEPLRAVLDVSFDDAAARLEELAAAQPDLLRVLQLVVAGGYYMSEEVLQAIGYPGQVAQPVVPDRYPAYIEEGLLDHMALDGV